MARKSLFLLLSLAAAAVGVLVIAAYLSSPGASRPALRQPAVAAEAAEAAEAQPAASVPIQVVSVPPAPGSCAMEPLVAGASDRDGQFTLNAALASYQAADPSPFLAVADESAREGRVRDAEVALLAACRIAGLAGATSAPVADVKSRLALHYTSVAPREPEAARTQLVERAQALLSETVQAYTASLGAQSSKARMAEKRLAALRVNPLPQTASMGAARHSLADVPPRSDEPVVQLDDDLQRLHAQARAVSRDPRGFQRRHQQAMAQREACNGDPGCLRAWHAQRKRQLFAEF